MACWTVSLTWGSLSRFSLRRVAGRPPFRARDSTIHRGQTRVNPTSAPAGADQDRPAPAGPARPHVLVVAFGWWMGPEGRGMYSSAEDAPWYRLLFSIWLTLLGVSTVRPVSVSGGASCAPDRCTGRGREWAGIPAGTGPGR